jgi:hypothetical protein
VTQAKHESPRRRWRSVGAVLAGLVFVVSTHTFTDVVMHATGVFPGWGQPMSDAMFALATVYRSVLSALGSYVAARLAPRAPMRHALALGGMGVVLGTAGAAATWNLGLGPHWYAVALVVSALPCAWAGGRLHKALHG